MLAQAIRQLGEIDRPRIGEPGEIDGDGRIAVEVWRLGQPVHETSEEVRRTQIDGLQYEEREAAPLQTEWLGRGISGLVGLGRAVYVDFRPLHQIHEMRFPP